MLLLSTMEKIKIYLQKLFSAKPRPQAELLYTLQKHFDQLESPDFRKRHRVSWLNHHSSTKCGIVNGLDTEFKKKVDSQTCRNTTTTTPHSKTQTPQISFCFFFQKLLFFFPEI